MGKLLLQEQLLSLCIVSCLGSNLLNEDSVTFVSILFGGVMYS